MAYTLSWSDDHVFVSLSGDVDSVQLMAMADEIASDSRFDDLRKRIYDCTAVTSSSLTAYDLKIYAHIDNAAYITNPNAHIVFVVNNEAFKQNMMLYSGRFLHKGWQLEVLHTAEEALAWQPVSAIERGERLLRSPSIDRRSSMRSPN